MMMVVSAEKAREVVWEQVDHQQQASSRRAISATARGLETALVRTNKVVEEVVMLVVVEVPMEMVVEGGGSGSESGNGYHYGSCVHSN